MNESKTLGSSIDSTVPTCALVTVCRNALSSVAITVNSVRQQLYPNMVYIVVDGASTDGTLEYLKGQSDCIDVLISEPDSGIYDAMNKAVEACPSESWVMFLNAGDQLFECDVLRKIIGLIEKDVDMVIGDVQIENPGGLRRISCDLNRRHEMPACHQSMLCRGSMLKGLKFDLNFPVGADFNLFARAIGRSGRNRIAVYKGIISRIAPQGYSAINEAGLRRDYFRTIARHYGKVAAVEWLLLRLMRGRLRAFSRRD